VIEIALGVVLFTGIVMCLVLLILLARSWLVPASGVEIRVNEARVFRASVGRKLLGVLEEAGLYLPSACGGKGTCGQCKVRVLKGSGAALPTERLRLTRREVAQGTRLACQFTIHDNLDIRVPDEVFGVQRWTCRVRSSRCVGTLMKELVLELPEGKSLDFQAGADMQVMCPPYHAKFSNFAIDPEVRDEWDRLDLWRYAVGTSEPITRAYSLANYPDEKGIATLIVRLAIPPPNAPASALPGVVSSYLFKVRPGDKVTVSGPFGHFFATESANEMIYVGGGAGMAPLRSQIFDQLKRLHSNRKISFWYGARSRRELFYVEDFDRLQAEYQNFRWCVALSEPRPEDDWHGNVGFIHQVLYDRYLAAHPSPEDCEYYLCGPPVMIRAVQTMLDKLDVEPESIRFDDFGG